MKKIAAALLCGALLSTASAGAESAIGVILNGRQLTFDSQPMIKNCRTFVPVRKIFESLGMEVDYENGCVSASSDGTDVCLYIGSNEMWVNGECIKLDAVPFIEQGRALVPVRAISEALGCNVDWDENTCSVVITDCNTTSAPTAAPTTAPTAVPTVKPTAVPTAKPTAAPTAMPTAKPTAAPTAVPTAKPTAAPTAVPTAKPTAVPTTRPTAVPTTAPAVSSERDMEQQVLQLVNKVRAQYGLGTLTWAEDLAVVARRHSSDMINRNFFDHTNPDGKSPFDRLRAAGISYRTAAENIAYGQRNADEVMNAWMNSSGHRANILNANVKEMGVGAVKKSNGTIYWTQMFVAR